MYDRSMSLYFVSVILVVTSAFLLPVTIDCMSLKALGQTQINQNREARKIEADRLYQQGIELLRKRQLPQAVEKFQDTLVIYQAIQNYDGEQRIRYLIGGIYEQLGESDRAQKYYPPVSESFGQFRSASSEEQRLINEELEPIAKEIKNRADQLYQQGIQQLRQKQLQQALQTFQKSLAIYKEVGFREIYSKVLYQIASIYEQLGESEQAKKYYQEAELFMSMFGTRPTTRYDVTRNSMFGVPPIRTSSGGSRGSESNIQRDDDEDPKTRADRLFKEGSQLLETGELRVARIKFEQVLGIRKKLGDRKGQTETLILLAKVHERLGNKNWAEQLNRRAREIGLR
ncbi:hypothetical protein NIES2119_13710 [[Phormidium ambiguum] IAM M-71]|uniref:Uncharacterized protein n=1 Tax=[Phormidium ambiguum] IAM M-71 TaxID=454136 RepID=A0A1U7IJI4_9CYAN|nr:tetratricopeptide repeat protein [Phormidium ambiguum]OKH37306.1 hypothetical protein NIES2119_13710 [Phormidium ambiguum IAM M-71]